MYKRQSVDRGIATVEKNLDRLIKKEKITEADKAEIMGRVHGSTDITIIKDADLVIEAATEDMEAKKALFKELDELCTVSYTHLAELQCHFCLKKYDFDREELTEILQSM